jgi:microcystin-dependent protein
MGCSGLCARISTLRDVLLLAPTGSSPQGRNTRILSDLSSRAPRSHARTDKHALQQTSRRLLTQLKQATLAIHTQTAQLQSRLGQRLR